MSNDDVKFDPAAIDEILLNENVVKEINRKLLESLGNYRKTLHYMSADLPLEVLGLPSAIHNILIANGCLRVYDLFDRDFTKIKGFGDKRIHLLTTCLNKFFLMG